MCTCDEWTSAIVALLTTIKCVSCIRETCRVKSDKCGGIQGSVWGSGSAAIVCAALALLQPQLHTVWQATFALTCMEDAVSQHAGLIV